MAYFILKVVIVELEDYKKAEKDYIAGMKYKEIAEKYNVSVNTVKSWKQRYGWNRKSTHTKTEKSMHTKQKKVCIQNQEEEIKVNCEADGSRESPQNEELTAEQQMFCIYYARTFNATQSYINVYHCKYESAAVQANKLLKNNKIKEEIERLKEVKRQQIACEVEDIIELNMRIAFSDMGNYITFGDDVIKLNKSDAVDTQLIQEVKEGKHGITIKLADKGKAMELLERYFMMNPMDKHKIEYDRRKAEIDLLKIKNEAKEPENRGVEENNNFKNALGDIVEDTWNEEKNTETE